jgi:hypothetical protein
MAGRPRAFPRCRAFRNRRRRLGLGRRSWRGVHLRAAGCTQRTQGVRPMPETQPTRLHRYEPMRGSRLRPEPSRRNRCRDLGGGGAATDSDPVSAKRRAANESTSAASASVPCATCQTRIDPPLGSELRNSTTERGTPVAARLHPPTPPFLRIASAHPWVQPSPSGVSCE